MQAVPGVRFLPNAITALALSSGLTSVVFASQGQWMFAMWSIAAATVLDSLDGPAARILNSSSRVGAELDSLSDLSAFGICPAILLYFWQSDVNHVGDLQGNNRLWFVWASCLIYAVCTALRLARFNSLLDDESPKPFAKSFFTGVPSPPGALLAMVPIVIWVQWGDSFLTSTWVVAVWTVLAGLLMVSTFPTIALKSVRVSPRAVVPLIVLLVFVLVTFIYQPRIVGLIGILIYIAHIPYAVYRYRYLSRHPELWDVPARDRPRRTSRRQLRLRVRPPRQARVAGRLPDGSPVQGRSRDPRVRRGLRNGQLRRPPRQD